MKALSLIPVVLAALFLTPRVEAATITVTAGFNPATAITVFPQGPPTATFTLAIGSWDGTTFTQFGTTVSDTGTINGAFTATGPTEVSGEVIHVYVGVGPVNVSGGQFVLLRSAQNTAFPSDVSATLASATFNMHNSIPGTVVYVTGNPGSLLQGNEVWFIPEPSSMLFGLLGGFGLLRRRR
jgi:hypothetical protein